MGNELLKQEQGQELTRQNQPGEMFGSSIFSSITDFQNAQRMVKPLADSALVPDVFRGKIGECLIALEMSQRIGANILSVMQNLYIVHGKPAWSSQFLIACVNACGRFSPIRYQMTGQKGTDTYGCIAWALDKSGEKLEGDEITIRMAKEEGWYTKNGSKWKTMPGQMLRYRAATFFARAYAPEITLGMHTEDEVIDVTPIVTEARPSRFDKPSELTAPVTPEVPEQTDLEKLQVLIDQKGIPVSAETVKSFVEKSGDMFSYDMVAPNIDAIAAKMEGAQ